MSEKWMRVEGRTVTNLGFMEGLHDMLEDGPLIVEHRHYHGACGPTRFITEDWDCLSRRIASATPGDTFHFWWYEGVCRKDNECEWGKIPNEAGLIPWGGA